MNRKQLFVALMVALLGSGLVTAQDKAKKLYRWVDKDGKVHFSDALPPEAVDQARKEFSAKSGSVTGQVDRALTEAERAALAAAAETEAEAAAREAERKRVEDAMLASYDTEADLTRAFEERLDLLKRTLEGIEVGISAQRTSLLTQLADAAESELAGRQVDAKRAATIRELHEELVRQQDMLMRREAELGALNEEQARTLSRYRELRDGVKKPEVEAAAGTGGSD